MLYIDHGLKHPIRTLVLVINNQVQSSNVELNEVMFHPFQRLLNCFLALTLRQVFNLRDKQK